MTTMTTQIIDHKMIGEILVSSGKITEVELQKAIDQQSLTPSKRIGEILIDLKCVEEDDLTMYLAAQFKIPFIKIENYSIDPEHLNLIPRSFVFKFKCLPMDKMGEVISFVISDPLDIHDLKQQESLLNCTMNFFLTTPKALENAITQYVGN